MYVTTTRRRVDSSGTSRARILAAFVAAAAFTGSAVLQLSDLNWVINEVQTVPQHIDMALFVIAIAGTMPALFWLGARTGRAGRVAAGSAIIGQAVICAITTHSNITGIDATWFNAAAAVANVLWLPALIVLAVLAGRTAAVPWPLAVGLVVAYAGTIPLAPHGGGLLAAAYWALLGAYAYRSENRPSATSGQALTPAG